MYFYRLNNIITSHIHTTYIHIVCAYEPNRGTSRPPGFKRPLGGGHASRVVTITACTLFKLLFSVRVYLWFRGISSSARVRVLKTLRADVSQRPVVPNNGTIYFSQLVPNGFAGTVSIGSEQTCKGLLRSNGKSKVFRSMVVFHRGTDSNHWPTQMRRPVELPPLGYLSARPNCWH